jgi:phosphoglycerol transferase MdoB-like AlkP superfamily enzyme
MVAFSLALVFTFLKHNVAYRHLALNLYVPQCFTLQAWHNFIFPLYTIPTIAKSYVYKVQRFLIEGNKHIDKETNNCSKFSQ